VTQFKSQGIIFLFFNFIRDFLGLSFSNASVLGISLFQWLMLDEG